MPGGEIFKQLFTRLSVIFVVLFLLYNGLYSLITHYRHVVPPPQQCSTDTTTVVAPLPEESHFGLEETAAAFYPIKPVAIPGLRCKPIPGHGSRGSMHIDEMRYSMAHHLMENDFDYVCAQHLDVQACMCVMRVTTSAVNGTEVQHLPRMMDVINLDLMGVSNRAVVLNRESSLFCSGMPIINVRRYESVYASMETINGEQFERWYSGQMAYSLQQIFEVQIGLPPCRDNLEELSRHIKEKE